MLINTCLGNGAMDGIMDKTCYLQRTVLLQREFKPGES